MAVAALPVVDPDEPLTLPVTLPTSEAVTVPAFRLANVNPGALKLILFTESEAESIEFI